MGIINEMSNNEVTVWANCRNTSIEIARELLFFSEDLESAQVEWECPSEPIETAAILGAWVAVDNNGSDDEFLLWGGSRIYRPDHIKEVTLGIEVRGSADMDIFQDTIDGCNKALVLITELEVSAAIKADKDYLDRVRLANQDVLPFDDEGWVPWDPDND